MDEQLPYKLLPEALLPWFSEHARELPWRADREPYHIWLSEIMLQQTRVEAVKAYYTRFLSTLPDIASLANADEAVLQKLWEGLGYYTRMRNLQNAARIIIERHNGQFPTDYDSIRALPGIGDYTAGAICSICFELPEPAIDGNVLRVISRVCGIAEPMDTPQMKRQVSAALKAVYPKGKCGAFTQALMELGAIVCIPNGSPNCEACPVSGFCAAYRTGMQTSLPVKRAKKARKSEKLTVWILQCADEFAIQTRPDKGLLAGLNEFPNAPGHFEPQKALDIASEWGVHPLQLHRQVEKAHIFTHVEWHMRAFYIKCETTASRFQWAKPSDIALPTAFRIFLED